MGKKKLKMVLFDLDGTLLPMDQEAFTRRYFGALVQKLAPMGYDPKKLIDSLWLGVKSMVKNDGGCTNEQAFWKTFASLLGDGVLRDIPVFDTFYRNEFIAAKDACGFNPLAARAVARVKELGLRWRLLQTRCFPRLQPSAASHGQALLRRILSSIPPTKTPCAASPTRIITAKWHRSWALIRRSA